METTPRPETPESDRPTRVIGIGASAGGLESLEQFFSNAPADTGMAFVIVQHLSPDYRSMMDELLSRHSDMPIRVVEHGAKVCANHVAGIAALPLRTGTHTDGRLRSPSICAPPSSIP